MKEMMPVHSPECDADTLMRAGEIKADSKRLGAAMKVLDKKKKAINSLADLKKAAYEKSGKVEGEDEDEEEDED